MIKNKIRTARYYKLAFKNNLQLTEFRGELSLLGDGIDFHNFDRQLNFKEIKEDIDDKIRTEHMDNMLDDFDDLHDEANGQL